MLLFVDESADEGVEKRVDAAETVGRALGNVLVVGGFTSDRKRRHFTLKHMTHEASSLSRLCTTLDSVLETLYSSATQLSSVLVPVHYIHPPQDMGRADT